MKTVIKFLFFCILLFTFKVYSDESSGKNKFIVDTQYSDIAKSDVITIFIPIQNKKILFLNDNGLQWHDNGMIKSGALYFVTQLFFTSIKDKLWFKTKTNVKFDKEGLVESGTFVDGRDMASKDVMLLDKNRLLKVPGGKEIEFKKDSSILKNKNNEVIYGTLTENKKFHNMASGRDIRFKKGFPLLIDSKGNIREGVLFENNQFMLIFNERSIWVKKDSSVLLTQKGRIRFGTLLEGTWLEAANGKMYWQAENTPVSFDPEGYLQ